MHFDLNIGTVIDTLLYLVHLDRGDALYTRNMVG